MIHAVRLLCVELASKTFWEFVFLPISRGLFCRATCLYMVLIVHFPPVNSELIVNNMSTFICKNETKTCVPSWTSGLQQARERPLNYQNSALDEMMFFV